METIRILTKNGVENTNIDGARDNNFNAGGRSGIVKGVLNEGTLTAQGNEMVFDTCELRISGHRVVIEEPSRITLSGLPSSAERFQYIAKITNTDGAISFELITTLIHELEQDDILNGNGVYEFEIGRFTHDTSGNITDVVRTADVITGGTGSGGSGDFNVGNVTTQTLDAGLNAEVDVEYNTETGKVDFSFAIPQGEKGDKGDGAGINNQNLLINPDFSINQRGQTSYTGTGYGVDRWKGYQLNVMVCTPRDGYGVTLSAPTDATGTGAIYRQPFEASQLSKLAGRTITVSFKVSANRGTSNIYVRTMANGNGVGDTPNINSGVTGVVSKTITLPSPLTSLEIVFRKGAGTLDVDIDWAKLEVGSVATEFMPPLIAEELPKCQRYYEKTPVKSVIKYARSTGQFYDGYISYKVTKRTKPTVKLYSNDGTVDTLYGSSEATNKEITTGWQTTYGFFALSSTNALTVGSRYEGYFTADAEIY